MPLSFDAALGVHAKALTIRADRTSLLASNLANADTPGYLARDIDFRAALSKAESSALDMQMTSGLHLVGTNQDAGQELLYRVPNQASLDGNSVDPQLEKAAFADNAMRYQASLTFLDQKFRGLVGALKGE